MSEPEGYTYDVFISYSSRDRAWVRGELLVRLESGGLKVCIDFRDFRRGAPTMIELERAVQTSRRTLLVLTPNYLTSEWATLESLMLQTLDPANRERRLIPLFKEACDMPLEIDYLTPVYFTPEADVELAWRQVLTAMGAPLTSEMSEQPTRASWLLAHPYAMPPHFTGRVAERRMLSDWLAGDAAHPLLVLRALGGFGKSALTWYWLLHDVDPERWPRVVWWSFYESDATIENFVKTTLAYLGVTPRGPGPTEQVAALLRALHHDGTLLVLDGFERELRAYSGLAAAYMGDSPHPPPSPHPLQNVGEGGGAERSEAGESEVQHDCISPLAEAFLQGVATLHGLHGKVLLTTRLMPHPLEQHHALLAGCREEELTQIHPDDALAFFQAQGIRGSHAEIAMVCERYGYHPLSLRLLAGLIVCDLRQPGDITTAQHLDVSDYLVQRKHHVLEQSFVNLTPPRQQLLSHIACFRSPVSYDVLIAIVKAKTQRRKGATFWRFMRSLFSNRARAKLLRLGVFTLEDLEADLGDLLARGLLQHDAGTQRFDLHPIVRRYAYDQLGSTDRVAAHGQLRDYFAAVEVSERVQRLEELTPLIELYHHTVAAEQYDQAFILFRDRINQATYYQFGAYQLQIELLSALFPGSATFTSTGQVALPRLAVKEDQGWTLNELANSYSMSGQPRLAVSLLEQSHIIAERHDNKYNCAIGLNNLANNQMKIGALRAATANLRRSIALCQEIGDVPNEAAGHMELGRMLIYCGAWDDSAAALATALRLFGEQNHVQLQGVPWAYRAQRALLLARYLSPQLPLRRGEGEPHSGGGEVLAEEREQAAEALAAAQRTLELADEAARTKYLYPRDYVRAHWLLGAAHQVLRNHTEAEQHLTEALTRCRGINAVYHEADILIDLARLRVAQNQIEEALGLVQEALVITERSDYVLQGADAHLILAELALADGDRAIARNHAQEAQRLATCDGPPDYTYKVAYDEAGALLDRI